MDTQIDLGALPVDTSAPVLVTGATGYVAGWIVKGLLNAGVTVHAAVRDPRNTAKVQHLLDAADASPGTLRLFASDRCATAPTPRQCRAAGSSSTPRHRSSAP